MPRAFLAVRPIGLPVWRARALRPAGSTHTGAPMEGHAPSPFSGIRLPLARSPGGPLAQAPARLRGDAHTSRGSWLQYSDRGSLAGHCPRPGQVALPPAHCGTLLSLHRQQNRLPPVVERRLHAYGDCWGRTTRARAGREPAQPGYLLDNLSARLGNRQSLPADSADPRVLLMQRSSQAEKRRAPLRRLAARIPLLRMGHHHAAPVRTPDRAGDGHARLLWGALAATGAASALRLAPDSTRAKSATARPGRPPTARHEPTTRAGPLRGCYPAPHTIDWLAHAACLSRLPAAAPTGSAMPRQIRYASATTD